MSEEPTLRQALGGLRSWNTVRALMKGIPVVGPSLEQFMFGRLGDLRLARMEQTMREMGARLSKVASKMDSEEFVGLLETVLPHLVRATNEDKRQRLRDLLVNAAQTEPGSPDWADAELAARLITELDPPALALLAAIARYDGTQPAMIVSRPKPQIVHGERFDWNAPDLGKRTVGYSWPVLEESCRRLHSGRLIHYSTHDARGGFGGLALTELGQLLIRWSLDAGEQSA